MKSPQLENGYTRIANEIFDALSKIRINGESMQILFVIWRKTYGFNKIRDNISLSQFSLSTGISKPHVIRAIKKLKSMNIIIAEKGNSNGDIYRFNKQYHEWKPLPKKVTLPKKEIIVAKKGNLPLPKKVPTKDTITKDNTKDRKRFVKPVILEVKKYIEEKKYKVNADVWYNYYESNGWVVGKNKMKSWKAAVKTWHYKNNNKQTTHQAEGLSIADKMRMRQEQENERD